MVQLAFEIGLFAPGVDITSAWNPGDTAVRAPSGASPAALHAARTVALHLPPHRRTGPKEVRSTPAAAAARHRNTVAGPGPPAASSQVSTGR